MDTKELIRHLEFEYFGIQEACPEWEMELWDFLISRKVDPDDIWGYSPDIGRLGGQLEPEWL